MGGMPGTTSERLAARATLAARARLAAGAAGVAFALLGLLAPSEAAASPEDLFGYGTRTSAMGATGVAHATGYEAAFHNPALASSVRVPKLTLGFLGGTLRLDANGPGLPGRTSQSPVQGTLIGAEVPIPFGGALSRRVGLALAFYQPLDVVVRGRVLYPEQTQFPILGDRAQSVTIRAGLGVDLGYGVRIGAGFAALAEIEGVVVAATDATGRVGTRVEDQLVATYAPTLGATYDLPLERHATWRVGAVYRGTLDARFAIVIDGTKLTSLQIPLFNISGLAQYDPAQIAIELARRQDLTVLALQLVHKQWSSFPGVLEPTVVCTEGGAGACGLVPPVIDWHDTVAIRAGADQGFVIARGATLHARGGAFYETSPLPDELPGSSTFSAAARGVVPVPTRYFDSDRLAMTVGTGLRLAKPFPPVELDLFAQYHFLFPRTVRSVDAAASPASQGRAADRPVEPLSEGESSGHITLFGMSAGLRF